MPEAKLVWFRRDLRDTDNAALAAALASAAAAGGAAVYCVFVFDTAILDALPSRRDRRVAFIHAALCELHAALAARGGGLIVRHGDARDEIPRLARELGADTVFAARDYEPAAKARDAAVAQALAGEGRRFIGVRDHTVFDGDAVLTQRGAPYTVFTPYRNAWLRRLQESADAVLPHAGNAAPLPRPPVASGVPPLAAIGFAAVDLAAIDVVPGMAGAAARLAAFRERIADYAVRRDFPAARGTSGLSVHLRFGTIPVRALVREALATAGAGSAGWLSELVWRDFYFMILDRFPHVVTRSFRSEYDRIVWDDWPEGLAAWRDGRTGYPLVDAAMRQLASTGFMHNRLRMLAASFLCKDLGIDWRLGEAWFAAHLIDFDLAANDGGWQWAASTGCDAQPWFRIFNPVTQSEKFDARGDFIRSFVPELAGVPTRWIHAPWQMPPLEQQACGVVVGRDYPLPIVDHARAREKTLARYAVVKKPAPDVSGRRPVPGECADQ